MGRRARDGRRAQVVRVDRPRGWRSDLRTLTRDADLVITGDEGYDSQWREANITACASQLIDRPCSAGGQRQADIIRKTRRRRERVRIDTERRTAQEERRRK
jgi:hypothetical protein